MTKKKEDVLEPTQEAVENFFDDQQRVARDIRYVSLENALTLHKNNGGMTQPNQIVATAQVFQAYLSGEQV